MYLWKHFINEHGNDMRSVCFKRCFYCIEFHGLLCLVCIPECVWPSESFDPQTSVYYQC